MQEKINTTDKNSNDSLIINEKIDYPKVRVINQIGEQLGIFSSKTALQLALDNNLDLVLVNGKSNPPVCKILNYGKYKFTQEKKARKARKKQQSFSIKEVKMRYKIEEHDYKVRINQILRFLEAGNKVKATIIFRGREVQHLHLAISLLNRIANELRNVAEVQQKPYREGKNLIMFLSAKKHLV